MPNPVNKKYLLLFCMIDQNNIIRGIPFKLFDSSEEALKFAEDDSCDLNFAITEVEIEVTNPEE